MSKFDIARLAAQLARTSAARHLTVDEIARDAERIFRESTRARRALEAGRTMAPHISRLTKDVRPYGAQLVPRGDTAGLVVGLKFDDGSYRNGAGNVFHVA